MLQKAHVIDVYPYRWVNNWEVVFLLLHRAASAAYAGQWRMVGGKVEAEETAWQAALREVEEETGQTPLMFWAVPSVNTFYEWQEDCINLAPVFAAELEADPVLDAEHDSFAWVTAETAVERLVWPEQQRLVRLIDRLLHEPLPPEWILG